MSVVVYTAILGGCDSLKPAPVGANRCVCFTDDPHLDPNLGWEIVKHNVSAPSSRLESRTLRCSSHLLFPSASAVVWIDASCTLTGLSHLLYDCRNADIAGLPHPDRSSCHDESLECVRLGYRSLVIHNTQMAEFVSQSYPFDHLTAGHLTYRRNTPRVATFNSIWLAQIMKYGARDQCSLDYSAWKAGLRVHHLSGTYRRNPYFTYDLRDHRSRRRGGT